MIISCENANGRMEYQYSTSQFNEHPSTLAKACFFQISLSNRSRIRNALKSAD